MLLEGDLGYEGYKGNIQNMSLIHSPSIPTNGLVLALDASNIKSYPGSGSSWIDLTGTGNNGTLSGVTYTGTPPYMSFASASSSTVSLGNKLDYTTESFSFSYWIYLNSYVTNQTGQGPVPFFKGAFQQNGYYCQIATNGAVAFETNQSGVNQLTNTDAAAVPLTTWTHICTTRSGASVKIYIKGIDATTVLGTHVNPTSSSEPFRIGSYNQTSGGVYTIYGNMRIANFTGYNVALTAEQALQNFNALRVRYGV